MNSITKALTDELEGKKLSKHAKQQILSRKPRKKRNFIPQIAAICICALALFLFFTNTEKKTPKMTAADAMFGYVDEAIVDYFNNEAPKLQVEPGKKEDPFHNGDAYLMRLALEQNSGRFYSDSMLSQSDRYVLSELLHYVQEAIWHNNVQVEINPVKSIDQLVEQAPALISQLKPHVEIPYMKVTDEKQRQWNYTSFDTKRWVSYVVVLALLLAAIIYLIKYKHFIITAFVILLAFVSFSQPFWQPFKDVSAYDEKTLVEAVEGELKKVNVKVVGQPELQYAASIHKTRTALVSFEDGMTVLAEFDYDNGRYINQGMTWHSGYNFSKLAIVQTHTINVMAFKAGHHVAKIRVENEQNYSAETTLKEQKPTIIYFKTPKELSSYSRGYYDANGELVH
ncbi:MULTISPECIES: hypothetical protein [unclassified Solibacillus]|uniref:hypothetical protein n=1 Tax=unclassified Solibacillus TaxID=2637870 RepID=UPI0030F6E5D4